MPLKKATSKLAERIAADTLRLFSHPSTRNELLSKRYPELDLPLAYEVSALIRKHRIAQGENPIGRKIGFTNRTRWQDQNLTEPIWGYLWKDTVWDMSGNEINGSIGYTEIGHLSEPRIEPEIIFGLIEEPSLRMDDTELLGCIGWIAHGFEIVQSVFPGWKFTPADAVAVGGLHAKLAIGIRHEVLSNLGQWKGMLERFEVDIYSGEEQEHRGHGRGSDVLGSPLAALRHLIGILAKDSMHPPLAAGEIVTTGTLTKAFPIKAGEIWSTTLDDIPLTRAKLEFI